ncbi:MAG TPA: type II toxin-antitoxin system VapB family antitoxin [Verrucomicrobiae bacterium]|jgi:Bacterial antitoxin of type II TA system, VapB
MKTTIDLDETKLKRVMKLSGLGTRRETIDAALTELERKAKLLKLYENPLPGEFYKDAIDPKYDLMKLRNMAKPKSDDTW